MWGILETIGAGLIVSLINICVYIYTYIVDVCRTSQEENDDDAMVSVWTFVSDASIIQHIHVYH